ncbi:LysO family transporter [Desulfofundulus thermosubterraneus]|uniref:Lysine exporter LysO n=1 Tax=Desulfofundulus thermosubterraneus DSM 16057 TaxID=1121432 RepID=A0A1M6DU33_9FIRM|nr:LysO family transporter [Desulfofundulus thermosubterraneus]SHI76685.1 Membrane protein of unknown function [Desulfofundulus thermosubterraneus DSM 16057]
MGFVLLSLAAGVFIGWACPLSPRGVRLVQKATLAALFVLLGSMGAQLGANEAVLRSLDTMGLRALVLAGASVAGSVLLVYLFTRLLNRLLPVDFGDGKKGRESG